MCNNILPDNDIKLIYKDFALENLNSNCVDENEKSVIFDIKKDKELINETITGRTYYRKNPLINYSFKGKVAKHNMFVLKEKYKNKGIAKSIHNNEIEIYKKNDFKQIHLDAAFDGIIVWKKLGFNYVDKNAERSLIMSWKKYAKDILGLNTKDTIKIRKISDIPKNKLKPKNKISFTEWYLKLEKIETFKMYKDIK